MSLKRVLAFFLLSGAFYEALQQYWDRGLSHWLIDIATVRPAAWLARRVCDDPTILADGSHLRSAPATLNVLFGCDGTDVLLVLAAAVLTTPVTWRYRLQGLFAGLLIVFAANQMRLLALFLALRAQDGWFGPLHGLIAPLGVVTLVTAYFLFWLRWSQRGEASLAAVN